MFTMHVAYEGLRSCLACAMSRRSKPQPHLSWMVYFLLCSFLILAGANDWPTYPHPRSNTQKCFLCPPGFFKRRDCQIVRDATPQWPTCVACRETQFSRRWNQDGRCWDQERCRKNHTLIYNGGNYGPNKCACTGSTLEDESGTCVDGISLSKHNARIKQLETSCDKRVKAASEAIVVPPTKIFTKTQRPCTAPEVECPLCEECPKPMLSPAHLISIGIFTGVIIASFFFVIYHFFRKLNKRNKEKENEEIKKPEKGLKHNGEAKEKVDQPTPSSPSQKTPGTPKRTPSVVVDSGDRKIVTDKKAGKSDSRSDESVVVIDEKKHQESAFKHHEEQHKPDKTVPFGGAIAQSVPAGCGEPAPAPVKQDRDLLDEALRVIEKKVTSIGEADDILRFVLELSADDCERIKSLKNSNITETIRYGFKMWCEREGKNATPKQLILSLKKHDQNSMADNISEKLDIKVEEESEKSKKDNFDRIVKICERILDAKHIKEFSRRDLKINEKDIPFEGDRKTFVRRALLKWREKKGKLATPEILLQLLADNSDLKNYADEVREEFNGTSENVGGTVVEKPESAGKAGPISNEATGTVSETHHLESSEEDPPSTHLSRSSSCASSSQDQMGSGSTNGETTQDDGLPIVDLGHTTNFPQETLKGAPSRHEAKDKATTANIRSPRDAKHRTKR